MLHNNKDFYPTPRSLFDKLMSGSRHIYGRVLEPSAGKGDIIEYIQELNWRPHSSDVKIDAIESDPNLVNILMGKGINVVWNDFLTYETFKEYDYIIMNPPFSNGVDHVLKALKLAEDQLSYCEVYAILNKETLNNARTTRRQELLRKLAEYGAKIRYVSGAFLQGERKTNVEVALIHAKIEKNSRGKQIYDSIPFFRSNTKQTKEEIGGALSMHVKPPDVAQRLNDIERLVLEYETACKIARETFDAIRNKQSFYNYISEVNKQKDRYTPLSFIINSRKEFSDSDLAEEIDRLRRGYWELILDTKEFREMLTNEAIEKLNKQMNIANEMEINLTNIRVLLMALNENRHDILIDSVVSIFQKITERHMASYSSNIHYYNGWRTNSAYKINKKIIVPIYFSSFIGSAFAEEYDQIDLNVRKYVDDIIKALQLIDPEVNNKFESLSNQEFENQWIRFKIFQKGTIHVWFKDEKLLSQLNYICGIHFNWVPGEDEQRKDPKAREWVVEQFGDVSEVKLLKIVSRDREGFNKINDRLQEQAII